MKGASAAAGPSSGATPAAKPKTEAGKIVAVRGSIDDLAIPRKAYGNNFETFQVEDMNLISIGYKYYGTAPLSAPHHQSTILLLFDSGMPFRIPP